MQDPVYVCMHACMHGNLAILCVYKFARLPKYLGTYLHDPAL